MKRETSCHGRFRLILGDKVWPRHGNWHPEGNRSYMLTLILYVTGLAGFVLFYKFVKWFEKI